MEKKIRQEKPSAKPYYAVSVLWILAAAFLPMHKSFTYIILVILSIALYIGLKKVLPKEYEEIIMEISETGNPEYDLMLREADENTNELIACANEIQDPQTKEGILSIASKSEAILSYLTKHPELISKYRKFFNYYLPTTLKLIKSYVHYKSLPIQEDNIQKASKQIEDAIPMLDSTFSSLYNSLFDKQTIDVTTELSAFENISDLDINIKDEGVSIYETK